jgi:hypothetical protein
MRGLRSSWATPAARTPSEASFSRRSLIARVFDKLELQWRDHFAVEKCDDSPTYHQEKCQGNKDGLLQKLERLLRFVDQSRTRRAMRGERNLCQSSRLCPSTKRSSVALRFSTTVCSLCAIRKLSICAVLMCRRSVASCRPVTIAAP